MNNEKKKIMMESLVAMLGSRKRTVGYRKVEPHAVLIKNEWRIERIERKQLGVRVIAMLMILSRKLGEYGDSQMMSLEKKNETKRLNGDYDGTRHGNA